MNYELYNSVTNADGSVEQIFAFPQSQNDYNPALDAASNPPWHLAEAVRDEFMALPGPVDENGDPQEGFDPEPQYVNAYWIVAGPWWILILRFILLVPRPA